MYDESKAKMQNYIDNLYEHISHLEEFKKLVHDELDEMDIPAFNDQQCRIAFRLEYVSELLKRRPQIPTGPFHDRYRGGEYLLTGEHRFPKKGEAYVLGDEVMIAKKDHGGHSEDTPKWIVRRVDGGASTYAQPSPHSEPTHVLADFINSLAKKSSAISVGMSKHRMEEEAKEHHDHAVMLWRVGHRLNYLQTVVNRCSEHCSSCKGTGYEQKQEPCNDCGATGRAPLYHRLLSKL